MEISTLDEFRAAPWQEIVHALEEADDPVPRAQRAMILKALNQHHNNGLLDNRRFEK